MLNKLSIQNYAIIDELEIEFSPHLNIITGETGAGKSIIAGALGLILGNRAEGNVLLNKEKKCIVEGAFKNVENDQLNKFLEDLELDAHEELIVRRDISPTGKSRAFINDTPVN
ncbi:MAG: AAA family ATPase, partial [Chitinophagaceae bacterium]|nr:AAA family ATPase [Chitinophagaceae bacterium]